MLHGNAGGAPSFGKVVDADLSGQIQVPHGGTGLASGSQGGVPFFDTSTTMASSATLVNHAVVVGGGPGAPRTIGTGTTGQVLISQGASVDPTWSTSSGWPVIDAATFGFATGNSAAANTTALNAAIAALNGLSGGSGILRFPVGTYALNTTNAITVARSCKVNPARPSPSSRPNGFDHRHSRPVSIRNLSITGGAIGVLAIRIE